MLETTVLSTCSSESAQFLPIFLNVDLLSLSVHRWIQLCQTQAMHLDILAGEKIVLNRCVREVLLKKKKW